VSDDHLLVFTMAEQASVVTCWDGHSKELIKNIFLTEKAGEMGTVANIYCDHCMVKSRKC